MGYADQEREVRFATSLQAMQCRKCGGVYALGSQFLEHKQEYGGSWVCPYCQTSWSYTESDLVCPCCNRHFTDLQKHMASKHPGYGGDKD